MASALSAEGRWRADAPVGVLQGGPMPEARRKRQKPGKRLPTLAQAQTAAQRSANTLDKTNKATEASKNRRTATPKKAAARATPAAAKACVQAPLHPLPTPIQPPREIKAAQLNIRGMRLKKDGGVDGEADIGLLHLVDARCFAAGYAVVCIQEHHSTRDLAEFPTEHYLWFFSDTNQHGGAGVCIGVLLSWTGGPSSPVFSYTSDRLVSATMRIEGLFFAFVSGYFPASSATDGTKDNAKGDLTEAFLFDVLKPVVDDFILGGHNVFALVDANCQVGRPAADQEGDEDLCLGPCCTDEKCTPAGLHLVEFCQAHDFRIEDTWHDPPPQGSGTWRGTTTREYVNAIDHILVRLVEGEGVEVSHCSVNRAFDTDLLGSDHLLSDITFTIPRQIFATQHTPTQGAKRNRESKAKKARHRKVLSTRRAAALRHGDYRRLRSDPVATEAMRDALAVEIEQLHAQNTDTTPEGKVKLHDAVCELFRRAVAEQLPRVKGGCPREDKEWYADSADTIKPLEALQAAAHRAYWKKPDSVALRDKWKVAGAALHRAMVKARTDYYLKRAKHTQHCYDIGDKQGFWAAAKPPSAKARAAKSKMSDTAMRTSPESNVFTSNPEECAQHWFDYGEALLGAPVPLPESWSDEFLPPQQVMRLDIGHPWTAEEVLRGLKLMRLGKTVGIDGMPIEVMRFLYTRRARNILCEALNAMLFTAIVPNEWKDVILVFIYKKLDKSLSANYRGIGLIAHSPRGNCSNGWCTAASCPTPWTCLERRTTATSVSGAAFRLQTPYLCRACCLQQRWSMAFPSINAGWTL